MAGLGLTLRENFRKKVTYQYGYAPRWSKEQARPISPRYRGRFVLIREPETGELRCTGCKICANACPGRCIEVEGENRKVTRYNIHLDRCLYCGLCVEACPSEALGMMQEPAPLQWEHGKLTVNLEWLAQPVEAPMPGVLPSTVGGDVRPGKKPFVPKVKKTVDGEGPVNA